ncbi:hypothetical protein ES705_44432 [subsurface metagenome]
MPNYEEIIEQSQANVKALSEKLKDLDKLHQDIKELIKQPEIFDSKYQQIVKLSADYTNTLGVATKKYLDGNNTLFVTNLSELSAKIKELKKGVTRLENIDIEKHFDKFQKTLSEIFRAINAINITLTGITKNLTDITQSLGSIQTTIDTYHKATKQLMNSLHETTTKHLTEQDTETRKNTELLVSKIKSLSEQNDLFKKEVRTNRIIQILGITIIVIILIYFLVK